MTRLQLEGNAIGYDNIGKFSPVLYNIYLTIAMGLRCMYISDQGSDCLFFVFLIVSGQSRVCIQYLMNLLGTLSSVV